MNNLLTPKDSLLKQVSWVPDTPFISSRELNPEQNSGLRIGLIASDRLYSQVVTEHRCFYLSRRNWKSVLKYTDLDFVLIDSFLVDAFGEWHSAQVSNSRKNCLLNEVICFAKSMGIPVVYWHTESFEMLKNYSVNFHKFDEIYCADHRSIVLMKEVHGIEAKLLPPCAAPRLFSPIDKYSNNEFKRKNVLIPNMAGLISSMEQLEGELKALNGFDYRIFDSSSQIWTTKSKVLNLPENYILGCVDREYLPELYRRSLCLYYPTLLKSTKVEAEWDILEALSCRLPVIAGSNLDLSPNINELIKFDHSLGWPVKELYRISIDPVYRERVAHKAWREVLLKHTINHRLEAISEDLGLSNISRFHSMPKAAFITPTYRFKFFERALQNFRNQTYENKELILVFNGEYEDYLRAEALISDLSDVKACYVDESLSAGPCLNVGIAMAESDYVFRVDDDDYYGPNYLLDQLLYAKHLDYDVIGKPFRYFVMNDRYPGVLFQRETKDINVYRPSVCMSEHLPQHTYIAGCSHGGKKAFFERYPFPSKNFGAVDSQWLDTLRSAGGVKVLCTDELNLVVDRRSNSDHTWKAHEESIIGNSRKLSVDKSWVVQV